MDGLLLRLLEDRGDPGGWFWRCFEPLRDEFACHFWIMDCEPWMGPPLGFNEEGGDTDVFLEDERLTSDHATVWKPQALLRWTSEFAEESITLWAIQEQDDPVATAIAYSRDREDKFICDHAAIWLIYTDSTCWEIFASDRRQLQEVTDHLNGHPSIRYYRSFAQNRRFGFAQIGLKPKYL